MEDIWGKATNFAPNFMQSYYQEGGMQSEMGEQGEVPQQAGGDQMQAITQEVATMLQQGADPQQVLQQLVEAGIPQEQAQQIIEMVMGQTQGGQQEATPQLRRGGYYQEGGEAMDEEMEGEDEGTEGETPSMEQLEGQVEQALKQGADPQELLQQLVEMGVPEEQAVQMIQEILQEIQGGETEMEAPEQPMMKSGGEYLAALKGRTIKNYTYNKNTGNYDVEFE
jgi:SOS response regulatory protein OraA/RecX